MPMTVVLAVGLEKSFLEHQIPNWQSADLSITIAGSIRDAIVHFKDGDFDLVLLGSSIPADSRERLTFLIRASGSRVPVVCIADSSCDGDDFVDATIKDEPIMILEEIKEIVANQARASVSRSVATRI